MGLSEADFLTLFVQLEAAPSWDQRSTEYRSGFHEWVRAHADDSRRILILEVDSTHVPAIREMWNVESDLRVVNATASSRPDDVDGVPYYPSAAGRFNTPYVTWRLFEAEVVDPTRIPNQVVIPALSVHQLRAELDPSRLDVEALSIDCASRSASVLTEVDLRDWDARVIALAWGDKGADSEQVGERLRSITLDLGYRSAGRGWGVAGANEMFVRTSSNLERLAVDASAVRTNIGRRVVDAREKARSAGASRSGGLRPRPGQNRGGSPTLDYAGQAPLVKIPVSAAIDLAQRVNDHATLADDESPQVFDLDREGSRIEVEARRCHDLLGVWPISFSHPRLRPLDTGQPQEGVSRIIPGVPYAFDDEGAYLKQYSSAALALTHRKAGWDCFRHVEILAAGSVPLMPDVVAIPRFSMVHYPIQAMREVAVHAIHDGVHPGPVTREAFRAYTQRFLTSQAMASYVLNVAGLQAAQSVLFVDAAVPESADYLSLLTLIGFKQLLGARCFALPEVDYVYADSAQATSSLYGRGFGFSRVLDPGCRSFEHSIDGGVERVVDSLAPDVIVIGSIARNMDIARRLSALFPMDKTIWIHGEDYPPSDAETRILRESGAHVFVRSIEPSGSPDRRSYAFAQSSTVW